MVYLKHLLVLFLFVSSKIAYGQLCQGTTVILLDSMRYRYEDSNLQLVFDEEFNGNALDTTRWQLPTSAQGASNGTGAYTTMNNVIVSPEVYYGERTSATGVCRVVIKKETVTRFPVSWNHSIAPVTYQYTTANFESIEEFGWGKYEIRCKLPKGKGFFPAFWMYGEHHGEGHEIDGFEFTNENDIFGKYDSKKLCKSVQMHYHSADNSIPGHRVDHNCGATFNSQIDYSLDYHTFTVVWNRYGISWYIDGEYIKTVAQWYDLNGGIITQDNILPSQVVLRNDWYPRNGVVIVFGMDVQHGSDSPDETTPFPSFFDIDYIRYYSY